MGAPARKADGYGYAYLTDRDGREAFVQGDRQLLSFVIAQLRDAGWMVDIDSDELIAPAPALPVAETVLDVLNAVQDQLRAPVAEHDLGGVARLAVSARKAVKRRTEIRALNRNQAAELVAHQLRKK
jgi:hypothetical protein